MSILRRLRARRPLASLALVLLAAACDTASPLSPASVEARAEEAPPSGDDAGGGIMGSGSVGSGGQSTTPGGDGQ